MNFSDTRRTGRRAELAVEDLFTSWSWIVGHDAIDEGYDLNVEPDRERYSGARFLVQVKGTSKPQKGKGISAPVSKSRLRHYLINPHPVIIVRSTADGALHWVHAQSWCQANKDRIASGYGNCSVNLDRKSNLADRESFECFLDDVLAPSERKPGAIAALVAARSEYLSSIDTRLQVRTSVRNEHETHAIYAAGDVPLDFEFRARVSTDGGQRLKEALEFGLPAELDVEEFRLTGSPLFGVLGANKDRKGRLALKTKPRKGYLAIRPGAKFSPFAPELRVAADWFNGMKGAAITNQAYESAIDLNARLSFIEDGSGHASVSIGFRSLVHERPIADFEELSSIKQWANQLVQDSAAFIELRFEGGRAILAMGKAGMENLLPWIPYAAVLSQLHQVARALDSDFILPKDYQFTAEDVADIELAFALLKGERRLVGVDVLDADLLQQIDASRLRTFHVRTTLQLSFAGRKVGSVPVMVDLENYIVELPTPDKLRLIKGEKGLAWIAYCNESVQEDGVVSRST